MNPAGMNPKPKILVAVHPLAIGQVESALQDQLDLIPVQTLDEAVQRLETHPDIAMILCGIHFDESHMFDLLRIVRQRFPDILFYCCRLVEKTQFSAVSLEAIAIAARSLGALDFINLPALADPHDRHALDVELRRIVMSQLTAGTGRE